MTVYIRNRSQVESSDLTLSALLVDRLSPRKERDLVLVRPDQDTDNDKDNEEHDQDDRNSHVPLHGGRVGEGSPLL